MKQDIVQRFKDAKIERRVLWFTTLTFLVSGLIVRGETDRPLVTVVGTFAMVFSMLLLTWILHVRKEVVRVTRYIMDLRSGKKKIKYLETSVVIVIIATLIGASIYMSVYHPNNHFDPDTIFYYAVVSLLAMGGLFIALIILWAILRIMVYIVRDRLSKRGVE